ncbi:hypothetical protein DSCA_39250 [Desulfosarcina alkanivorans]|jgi:hypothetical protein|uniref:Uncharacterized protein n=1 Tax=Desulfosarcina alkanivorans TaxID=571177 RepID=A0A5K7YNW1_9BACT|nr:hypothetical protein [Desulfosarcina alkanivorans]BBO69995.1 hypothetical protein DSCA_39250 [Desulfosarcina alkanivorans]
MIPEPCFDEPGTLVNRFRVGVGGFKADQVFGQVDDLSQDRGCWFSCGIDGDSPWLIRFTLISMGPNLMPTGWNVNHWMAGGSGLVQISGPSR